MRLCVRLDALETLARYRYLGKHLFAAINRMKLRLPLGAGDKLAGLGRIGIQDILVHAFDRGLDGHFVPSALLAMTAGVAGCPACKIVVPAD